MCSDVRARIYSCYHCLKSGRSRQQSPRAVLAQEKMLLVSCGSFAKRCWCQSLESAPGFRLVKCLASMATWLCTHKAKGALSFINGNVVVYHKAKGAFPSMHSDRTQWMFHWFGGLVNSNIP